MELSVVRSCITFWLIGLCSQAEATELHGWLVPRGRKDCSCYDRDNVPLLEKNAGAIKGYYVVIIILSLLIVLQTIAWFSFLYYRSKRLRR